MLDSRLRYNSGHRIWLTLTSSCIIISGEDSYSEIIDTLVIYEMVSQKPMIR